MKKRTLALCAAVWIAFLPNLALAQGANTVGNTGSPSATGGIRILGTDGTNDQQIQVDASGRFQMLSPVPVMEVIQHFSNRTLASAGIDSSGTPFSTAGYTKVYYQFRVRSATVGGSVEFSVRGHNSALLDSTQGWWFTGLGKGGNDGRGGKILPIVTLRDRFQQDCIADSLKGIPYAAPYMSIWLHNLTGAQLIYDLWFLGVR